MLFAARAAIAIVLGLVLTFAQQRSATLGLASFGIAAVPYGALGVLVGRGSPRKAGMLLRLSGGVFLLGGVLSLVLSWAGPLALISVVAGTGIFAGALEIAGAIRSRGAGPARDLLLSGVLTVLLGLVVTVVPPGYAFAFHGLEPVSGVLTASVIVLGVVGGWAIIEGVFLGIAAVSLRDEVQRSGAKLEGAK